MIAVCSLLLACSSKSENAGEKTTEKPAPANVETETPIETVKELAPPPEVPQDKAAPTPGAFIALDALDVSIDSARVNVGDRVWTAVPVSERRVWSMTGLTLEKVQGDTAHLVSGTGNRHTTRLAFLHPLRSKAKAGDIYAFMHEYGRVKRIKAGKATLYGTALGGEMAETEWPIDTFVVLEPGWSAAAPVVFTDDDGDRRGGMFVHRGEETTYLIEGLQLVVRPSASVQLVDPRAKLKKGQKVSALREVPPAKFAYRPAVVTKVHGKHAGYTVKFTEDDTVSVVSIGRVFARGDSKSPAL